MRICLYAGPGAGKSATTSKIFAELKQLHYNVELVSEYIKNWAYQGIVPRSFDQLYVFAKQLRAEDICLRYIDHIVTDSPLLMLGAYVERDNVPVLSEVISLCRKFNAIHPAIHILLDRDTIPYQSSGRYETLEQAKEMDSRIEGFLVAQDIPYEKIRTVDFDAIMQYVRKALGDA